MEGWLGNGIHGMLEAPNTPNTQGGPMPSRSYHTPSQPSAQVDPCSTDLWANEVVPHLPADLEEQARILGAFRRRRALVNATTLLRALLASVLITTSLQHLACWAVVSDV